jgi:hypothetical protein
MPEEKFVPTHLVQVGKSRWQMKLIGPIGRGKVDKLLYYNGITHPRTASRTGVHLVTMIPETRIVQVLDVH